MRVLLAQDVPRPRDILGNLQRIKSVLTRHRDADLAGFPELFLTGYQLDGLADLAADVTDELRTMARETETALVVGYVEPGPFNSLLCVDTDGRVAGNYRKTHLFGDECAVFEAGDRLSCVELAGVRIGPMICFDLELPEVARTLVVRGAQLLVAVAANMRPYADDHALAARARALDNRRPLVYVNRAGHESGFDFVGGSCVVSADGRPLAELGESVAVEMVEVGIGSEVAPEVDYPRHLRPELYEC